MILVEYDVPLVLALLRLSAAPTKKISDLSSQLSCLYSPETVISFFGKLNSGKVELEDEPTTQTTATTTSKSRHHGLTSSIFSFFQRSALPDSGKYAELPMQDLESKNVVDEVLIDVDRLGDICEVNYFSINAISYRTQDLLGIDALISVDSPFCG